MALLIEDVQESRAAARKPCDAKAVLFSLVFAKQATNFLK